MLKDWFSTAFPEEMSLDPDPSDSNWEVQSTARPPDPSVIGGAIGVSAVGVDRQGQRGNQIKTHSIVDVDVLRYKLRGFRGSKFWGVGIVRPRRCGNGRC